MSYVKAIASGINQFFGGVMKRVQFLAAASAASMLLAGSLHADVISFRDGENGYTGTIDTTIFASQPTNNNNASGNMFVGVQTTGNLTGPNQILIKYTNLFGNAPGQIEVGSTINSATLTFSRQFGFVDQLKIYDLTWDFEPNLTTVTWDNAGTTANDGIVIGTDTAATATDGPKTLSSTIPTATFDVTASLQAWVANPAGNLGWALINDHASQSNTSIGSSDNATMSLRPILTIDYTPIPEPASLAVVGLGGLMLLARRRTM